MSGTIVASVGAALRDLLRDRMQTRAAVTVASPANPPGDAPGRRINLFLYAVDRNAHLANQDLSRDGHPSAYGRPALPLDLHYLVTAYGDSDEDSLSAHEALGEAMRVLHDHAVLDPRDPALHGILDSDLRALPEPVRTTLAPASLETLTSIWQALSTPMRASALYRVQVALLESKAPRRRPRPVGELPDAGPRVHVAVAPAALRVHELRVVHAGDTTRTPRRTPAAHVGDTLVLHCAGRGAREARVLVGPGKVEAVAARRSDDRVEAVVPDDPQLQPGDHWVQLALDAGSPDAPVQARSNRVPFVLVPRIDAVRLAEGHLVVEGSRLHAEGLGTEVLLDSRRLELADAAPSRLRARLPDPLPAGPHQVRVVVGGAEAPEAPKVQA